MSEPAGIELLVPAGVYYFGWDPASDFFVIYDTDGARQIYRWESGEVPLPKVEA